MTHNQPSRDIPPTQPQMSCFKPGLFPLCILPLSREEQQYFTQNSLEKNHAGIYPNNLQISCKSTPGLSHLGFMERVPTLKPVELDLNPSQAPGRHSANDVTTLTWFPCLKNGLNPATEHSSTCHWTISLSLCDCITRLVGS